MSSEILQSGNAERVSLFPGTIQDYIAYFAERDYTNSPLQGYSECAQDVIASILELCRLPQLAQRRPLILKPRPSSSEVGLVLPHTHRLYEHDSPAALALVELTHHLFSAEQAMSNLDENGQGRVVHEGYFAERPIYFVESFKTDENGRYMRWDVGDDKLPAEWHEDIRTQKKFTQDQMIGLFKVNKEHLTQLFNPGGMARLEMQQKRRRS